jgi:hypothetical protein
VGETRSVIVVAASDTMANNGSFFLLLPLMSQNAVGDLDLDVLSSRMSVRH